MVERNGRDYARYLGGVFYDDPDFRKAAHYWAEEEVQHGDALAKWAELADPEVELHRVVPTDIELAIPSRPMPTRR